ncbi:hypothetical protein AMJ50_02705 [Parcubacteria bacterium DG_74_3]|nr:MAG: hypothetical protein AMJ50_02705 [Parcubacteria bacterium DG_74_3]
MRKIDIFINNQKFEAELNQTKTSQKIYQSLPIETEASFWGNEIYFEVAVKIANENLTKDVRVGDLAFWPEGNSFCIFYGPTPVSINNTPKPASPVTIIGKIYGNLEKLKELSRAQIKIIVRH